MSASATTFQNLHTNVHRQMSRSAVKQKVASSSDKSMFLQCFFWFWKQPFFAKTCAVHGIHSSVDPLKTLTYRKNIGDIRHILVKSKGAFRWVSCVTWCDFSFFLLRPLKFFMWPQQKSFRAWHAAFLSLPEAMRKARELERDSLFTRFPFAI